MRNMIQDVSIGRISQQAAIARSNECTDAEKVGCQFLSLGTGGGSGTGIQTSLRPASCAGAGTAGHA